MWLDSPLFPLAVVLVPMAWLGLYAVVRRIGRSTEAAFLWASIGFGALFPVLVEIQNLLGALDPRGVLVSWVVVTVGIWIAVAVMPKGGRAVSSSERPATTRLGAWETALLTATCAVALVLAVSAWRSPVTSWDAVGYHLPRIMYWVQYGSIEHYPTADPRPLFMNPWTAYVQLEVYLLAGSDRYANLVQWAAMVGSLFGAAALVRAFGGRALSQIAAAALVVSIPLGIEQATSSMIDYSATFWTLLFVLAVARTAQAESHGGAAPWVAGGALGLAVLSKGTAVPVVAPFALLYGVRILRRERLRAWKPLGALALAALLLNVTHWGRNVRTFGHPNGPPSQRALLLNESFHPRFLASNMIRQTFANLGSWDLGHATWLLELSERLHGWIDVEDGDLRNSYSRHRLTIGSNRWGEDPAGNPFHLVLYASCGLLLLRRGSKERRLAVLGACVFAAAALFCLLVKYQVGIARLQLPLFALGAPVAALVLERFVSPKGAAVAAALGLVLSVQWIAFTRSRPLVGAESVFTRPRAQLEYRWAETHRFSVERISNRFRDKGLRTVGLVTDGLMLEYHLWRGLRRHNPAMPRLENLLVDGYSEPRFAVPPDPDQAPRFVVWFRAADRAPDLASIAGRPYALAGRWDWNPYAVYRRRE